MPDSKQDHQIVSSFLPRAQERLGSGERSPCEACPIRPQSICSAMSLDELSIMDRASQKVTLSAGDNLFEEGDSARYRYNITSGCLAVYKLLGDGRRQIVGFLFPGDFLGLSVDDLHAFGALAICKTIICRFGRQAFDDIVRRFPSLERRIYEVASNELAVAQDQIVLLGRKTAKEKVATMLLRMAERAERRGMDEESLALPMKRHDIADYLGLTTETVSRTFTQFRKAGLIQQDKDGRVQLMDREALEDMMEGF